jgi:hypothetical protein
MLNMESLLEFITVEGLLIESITILYEKNYKLFMIELLFEVVSVTRQEHPYFQHQRAKSHKHHRSPSSPRESKKNIKGSSRSQLTFVKLITTPDYHVY